MLSFLELSPVSIGLRDHTFIAMKSFFDAGNEPDSTQYEIVTLGAFIGSFQHWRKFDAAWKKTLAKHGTEYAHATDATALQNDFLGWTDDKVDNMYSDCVKVIRSYIAIPGQRLGISVRVNKNETHGMKV